MAGAGLLGVGATTAVVAAVAAMAGWAWLIATLSEYSGLNTASRPCPLAVSTTSICTSPQGECGMTGSLMSGSTVPFARAKALAGCNMVVLPASSSAGA
ncbi:hypothetical protein D3C81_1871120 [compost metagenome]